MSFFNELKRRNVFKVAAAYTIVAWLLLQVSDTLVPALHLPEWFHSGVAFLLILGFPIALIFAWAYEMTPDGLRKETKASYKQPGRQTSGRKLDYAIIVVLVLALGYFSYDRFLVAPKRERALLDAVVTNAADEVANHVDLAARPGKSIAVLPFDNRSADEENAEFFAAGVHDELLTVLSKLGDLRVISRTSVESLDSNLSIPEIGVLLNVTTVLEGQVQRAGDHVRINVQLIDASTDEHLWAEIYDRQLSATSIFLIQSEIATAIATALKARLSPQEQERIGTIPTENLAALEAYFLGNQSMTKRTSVELVNAINYFSKAIEHDPGFALAYIGQANAISLQTEYGGLAPQKAFSLAMPIINKALLLDELSGEAHAVLGLILQDQGRIFAAQAALQRALELSPGNVNAHLWYSNTLRDIGHYATGLDQIMQAIQLDPLSVVLQANLGTVLFEMGRSDESLTQFKKAIAMNIEYPAGYWSVGGLYWTAYAQLDKALPWLKQGIEKNPGDEKTPALLGLLYLDLGDVTEAEHWINKALALEANSPFPNWAKEMLLVFQGKSSQANVYANNVLQQHPGWALSLAHLRNRDLREGHALDARNRYEEQFPELFTDDELEINRINVDAAIDLALIMSRTGDQARADLLLNKSLEFADATSITGMHWYTVKYGIAQQVQIYALQGESRKALDALRLTIDSGWRGLWWYWLEHDPNLDSIRQEPEFQAMLQEIKTDMAEQLERINQIH